jgi:23S rRNA pseudouridine2605 synthase
MNTSVGYIGEDSFSRERARQQQRPRGGGPQRGGR